MPDGRHTPIMPILACQANIIELLSGVRLPDSQVFPTIYYEACMTVMLDSVWPAYLVVCWHD